MFQALDASHLKLFLKASSQSRVTKTVFIANLFLNISPASLWKILELVINEPGIIPARCRPSKNVGIPPRSRAALALGNLCQCACGSLKRAIPCCKTLTGNRSSYSPNSTRRSGFLFGLNATCWQSRGQNGRTGCGFLHAVHRTDVQVSSSGIFSDWLTRLAASTHVTYS